MFKTMLFISLALTGVISTSQAEHSDLPNANFTQTLRTSNAEGLEDPYFQVKAVKVRELSDEESLRFIDPTIPPVPTPPPAGDSGGIISTIDKIIAIGQKIMPIIKAGVPVVNNNPMSAISVLPRTDLKDQVLHEMGGWSIPVSKHYQITFENALGMDVVTFIYSISYQHSGNIDGKGKYLTGVRASARDISVYYGFDLDASSQLLQISNVGTKDNIIAGATLEMSYTVKNWTRNITTHASYFVSGDGKFHELDN